MPKRQDINKVMIIGSGPMHRPGVIRLFRTQACKAFAPNEKISWPIPTPAPLYRPGMADRKPQKALPDHDRHHAQRTALLTAFEPCPRSWPIGAWRNYGVKVIGREPLLERPAYTTIMRAGGTWSAASSMRPAPCGGCCRPDWSGKLPAGFVGADMVQSASDFAGVAARVALTDDIDDELKVVNAIKDRITVMSLGHWIAAGRKDVKAEDVPLTKGDYPTLSRQWKRSGSRGDSRGGIPELGPARAERHQFHRANGR